MILSNRIGALAAGSLLCAVSPTVKALFEITNASPLSPLSPCPIFPGVSPFGPSGPRGPKSPLVNCFKFLTYHDHLCPL
uniref:Secreted protein n=1 Tax=Gasterosteus aculeatus aculeatus TaxID=481459 RepID=A0AAQ4RHL2_GASAC